MATGAYKRLLGLLQAQRKDAVSQAGFSLGKNVIEEREEIRDIQDNIDKEGIEDLVGVGKQAYGEFG